MARSPSSRTPHPDRRWQGLQQSPAKHAILEFIRATTDPSSKEFVPPDERIATFDQDGTLWVEHPIHTQVVYCLDRLGPVRGQLNLAAFFVMGQDSRGCGKLLPLLGD
jgi:hypothetical protein